MMQISNLSSPLFDLSNENIARAMGFKFQNINEIYNDKFRLSKVTYFAFVLVLLFSAFLYYRDNYLGYRRTSVEVEYNLKAIEEYQASNDKSKLTLKKVPPSLYGYNLGNWNTMPYFMKQCYRISEDTIIEYID